VSTTSPPGSERNRGQLIESHLPLVRSIAKRYAGRGENLEDLVQVGSIGLIRASDRFDPTRGAAFATFAAPAIEGEIRRHLGDRASAMRIPRELQRLSSELQRCRAELGSSLGRAPTVTELAAALDRDPSEVDRALDAERARQPSAALPDDATAEPESLASTDDRLLVAAGAQVLDERERRIVFLRFHADMTEQDIASDLGISQAHVSRLLSAALTKLRTELSDDGAAPAARTADTPGPEPISPGPVRTAPPTRNGKRGEKGSPEPDAKTKIEPVGARSKEPAKKSGHSGRFLVRMPSALHAKLTAAAEHEQVSLNRFVTEALDTAVSEKPPNAGSGGMGVGSASPPPAPDDHRRRHFRTLLVANIAVIVVAVVVAAVLIVLALERGI
jgi:RNA polymerase sigma-B factor